MKFDLINHVNGICDRIERIDQHLHCFVGEKDRRARLLAEAEMLLNNHTDTDNRPPLFGLSAGIKDIYRVNGLETACGSKLPTELFSGEEASIVRKLKQAGAIIAGKTATTEFAWFAPGLTRNPINTEHTPGGSSSGSAAAVAAGLTSFALGTQTIGSVIRPAAYCGIVGVIPGKNNLPTDGIIPFSDTFDQAGFFTKDLQSAEKLASVLCSHWQDDQKTNSRNPVIGIADEAYLRQADPITRKAFKKQTAILQAKGFRLHHTKLFHETDQINTLHKALAAKEFSEVHEVWYKNFGHLYSLHSSKLIHEGRKTTRDQARAALHLKETTTQAMLKLMTEHEIDCWISPSATSLPPKGLQSTGSPLMNLPWTFTGIPCISMPIKEEGLTFPVGLQLSGKANGLKNLFYCAKIIQKAFE